MMKKIIAIFLVALLTLSLSTVVFAADEFASPTGDDFYNVVVKVKDNKGGIAVSDVVSVKHGETAVIKATPDEGYTFGGWTFTGDFEWVSGDANSETITVRAFSDLLFVAEFNGEGGPAKDHGGTSPEMGNTDFKAIIIASIFITLSAGIAVYTGKKYFEA